VVSGFGLMGLRNKTPQAINTGDTVWTPTGEEHGQGASSTHCLISIIILYQ